MGQRKTRGRDISGCVVVDKPAGQSSNAIVQQVKRIFNARKAGHTGSLDPLATGVLPVCLGESTKFCGYLLDADKTYITTARMGVCTTTGDSEGEVTKTAPADITAADIEQVLPEFTGLIRQVPPMYSALKYQGEPLYKLARAGITVERTAREITVHSFRLRAWNAPYAEFFVHCSKGTYIRTLVEDTGLCLGCGAHVTALRRLKAGPFTAEEAVTPEMLMYRAEQDAAYPDSLLRPVDAMLSALPQLHVPEPVAERLQQGQTVSVPVSYPQGTLVRLYCQDTFKGTVEVLPGDRIAPKRLLRAYEQESLDTPVKNTPARMCESGV